MKKFLVGGTAATGVLVASVLATTHLADDGGDGSKGERVPWADTAGQPFRIVAGSEFPPCLAATVLPVPGEAVWGGVWHDAVSGSFTLRSTSPLTCSLAVPSISAIGDQRNVTFDTSAVPQEPVVVGPGGTVSVQVLTDDACEGSLLNSTALTLTFPQGSVPVLGATLPIQCGGGRLVDFHSNTVGAADVKGPTSSLEASITDLPTAVAPGATLDYTVTLHNPTPSNISLAAECPAYEETLKGIESSASVYQLNCAQGTQVPAGGDLSFAMQLTVPASAPSGPTFLTWQLQVPMLDGNEHQFASAPIEIS